jgi:hypothetical protein
MFICTVTLKDTLVNVKKPLHFLLRYSDKITQVDTIAEHQKIEHLYNEVWMGKFGVGIATHIADKAIENIKSNQHCKIFLMNGCNYSHVATVIDILIDNVHGLEIRPKNLKLIPEYYRKKACYVWFKLSSIKPFTDKDLTDIRLFNEPGSKPSKSGMRGLIYLTDTSFDHLPKKVLKNNLSEEHRSLLTDGLFD